MFSSISDTELERLPEDLRNIVEQYSSSIEGVILRPYTNYKKENISILKPKRVYDDGGDPGYLGEIMYRHGDKLLPFKIETPRLLCVSGVCEERYHPELRRARKEGRFSQLEGIEEGSLTGILRLMCEFFPTDEESLKFREILLDIYIICLNWMWENGHGNGGVLPGFYSIHPDLEEEIRKCRLFPCHLRTPIQFQTKIIDQTSVYGYPSVKEKIDLDSPQYLDLSADCYHGNHKDLILEKARSMVDNFNFFGVISPQLFVCGESFIKLEIKNTSILPISSSSSQIEKTYSGYVIESDHSVLGFYGEDDEWRFRSTFNPQKDLGY